MDREQEIRRFFLLQVNDALFPIGGYSHSQGLETYIQQGSVCDEKTAAEYIHKKLRFALAYTDLLAVRLAWELADQNDADGLDELEEILGASRIPFEQREASRKMGSRFAKTIEKLHAETMPMKNREIFEAYLDARKGKAVSHCIVYGVFCAAANIDLENALDCFLYTQTSGLVVTSVKTIPLSQTSGQQILYSMIEVFDELIEEVMVMDIKKVGLASPGFDLRCMQHEYLYSRLYMS